MQYVPAAQHSQVLIAWLNRYARTAPDLAEVHTHIQRLRGDGHVYAYDQDGEGLAEPRIFGRKRAHDAWLREHLASEPMSLLHGVVL